MTCSASVGVFVHGPWTEGIRRPEGTAAYHSRSKQCHQDIGLYGCTQVLGACS